MSTPNGDGSEFTLGGLTFQITYLPGLNRIQLWLRVDEEWVFVHGRTIPRTGGLTPAMAIAAMRMFVLGQINQDRYNRLLPGN